LARYFHLDRSDREITDGLRGDHNHLGFALMLGSARFLGTFPGADLEIPNSVTAFLASQLGLKRSPSLKGYFDLGGQRKRHLVLIRERYGFTEFADNGRVRFRLTRWLYALCWSGDDHPGPLIEGAASWLVVNKVLLPGVSVLERFVGRIRDRAQTRLWKRLVAALDEKQRERIAKLRISEIPDSDFANSRTAVSVNPGHLGDGWPLCCCHSSSVMISGFSGWVNPGAGFFRRMLSPLMSMRWALWMMRSRMASAMVGSPII
jgi:hypothetical protein